MNIQEIKKNLTRGDKLLCATFCGTSEATINQMLLGIRNRETELGKKIMSELERLAKINIQSKYKKQST